jgi:hypothetical protein
MTQLKANGLKPADAHRNIWDCVPEHGTPFEAVLNEKYWAHNSVKMKTGDRIEVRAADGSYYAELYVQDAGRLYAKVAVLSHVELGAVDVQEGSSIEGYEVRWCGPRLKWCVMRGQDRLKSEMDKGTALAWAQNHAKAA